MEADVRATTMRGDEGHWTLDKRIPLALIFGLFLQAGGFIWWVSKIDSRVASLEAEISTAKHDAKDVNNRLIRLEEKSIAMLDILRQLQVVLQTQPRDRMDRRSQVEPN